MAEVDVDALDRLRVGAADYGTGIVISCPCGWEHVGQWPTLAELMEAAVAHQEAHPI